MRTLAILALATLIVAPGLAGCSETLASLDLTGSITETKPDGSTTVKEASASAGKPEDAICAWAEAAGIPNVQLSTVDSPETKRKVTSILGAYNVTCKKQADAAPAATPAKVKVPLVKPAAATKG